MDGRRILAALAVAVVAALAGCGGGGPSLADLAQRQQSYAGERVDVHGVVRAQRDPNGARYYVLSDGRGDLVGLEPAARARRWAGKRVDVRGRFSVQAGFGRVIRIASIGTGPGA